MRFDPKVLDQCFPNLSSRYPNQCIGYVLLPSIKIFRISCRKFLCSDRSSYRTTMWFRFCLTPRRIADYPHGL